MIFYRKLAKSILNCLICWLYIVILNATNRTTKKRAREKRPLAQGKEWQYPRTAKLGKTTGPRQTTGFRQTTRSGQATTTRSGPAGSEQAAGYRPIQRILKH